MPNYHRPSIPGGCFFFTVVTFHRQPFLTESNTRAALHAAFQQTMDRYPFRMDAICLLPDHLHCIWTLPEDTDDFSIRWRAIKGHFSTRYRELGGIPANISPARIQRREIGFWQRRFWEHTIRDEKDLNRHIEYIHYNPVKHGLVQNVRDWEWSSFHRYVHMGLIDENWGSNQGEIRGSTDDFGE
jgi:putative transposase